MMSSFLCRYVALLVVLLGSCWPATVFGREASPPVLVFLDWNTPGPETPCMGGEAVRGEVERLLNRGVFAERGKADVIVEARIAPWTTGWQAQITMFRADGTAVGSRRVRTRAQNCIEFERSLPLVIALMVDIPKKDVPRFKPPPRPTGPPWELRVGAGALLGAGLVPGLAWGVQGLVGLQSPQLLGFEVQARQQQGNTEQFGGSARFIARDLSLLLCLRPLRAAFALDTCLGGQVGLLQASPKGFELQQGETRPTANAVGTFRIAVKLFGPIAFAPSGSIGVPLIRDDFQFESADGVRHTLYRPAIVHGVVSATLLLTLPL